MRNTLVDPTKPLPVHPVFGRAIGWRMARSCETSQQPIWSMAGGAESDEGDDGGVNTDDPPEEDKDDGDKPKDDKAPGEETVSKADFLRLKEHLSQADKKRTAAEKALHELQTKDLPEVEKTQAELAAAVAERDDLSGRYTTLARTTAFLMVSQDLGIQWVNAKSAIKVGEFTDLEVSDDGTVIGMKEALKTLAKDHPYLVAKPDAGEEQDPEKKKPFKSGSPVGGKGTGKTEGKKYTDEQLRQMMPALRL